jgi:hypothetical protein
MIADRDIYADKHGNLTDDPNAFALQVAVKGCQLDDRIARRFGIADSLVSTSEPNAVRRVTGRNASSVRITKASEAEAPEPVQEQPQEPADAVETKKPTAKKEK